MDDFFDFEDAANPALLVARRHIQPQDITPPEYDIDLILAQAVHDENSFNSLQPFPVPLANGSAHQADVSEDAHMWQVDDFNDFSRWMNSGEHPAKPCVNCRNQKLECRVIGSSAMTSSLACTSCVALCQPCSMLRPESTANIPVAGAVGTAEAPIWTVVAGKSLLEKGNPTETDDHDMQDSLSSTAAEAPTKTDQTDGASRFGARFPRDTVRILRGWLLFHHKHPYPTEDEKEELQSRTGLNKVQITNWLANARRRGQVKVPRSKSPIRQVRSQPVNIPRRSSKPIFQSMGPMERWESSPPEHEPASVTAIARAVTSSELPSKEDSPDSYPHTDDGSVHSLARASSASSRNTSQSSSRSLGSALSHQSRVSFGEFGRRGRRRRRQAAKAIQADLRQYQCTFCIETFKTKHDWQRHEKSLHLSLERWVCAPGGSIGMCPSRKQLICVFCGLLKPSNAHLESHNYASCLERAPDERTFYRKDHLRQHLRLVHDSKFICSSMDEWRIPSPDIRSRCGFCDHTLINWPARVDHLADHFKAGSSMADWEGDWGLEPHVVDLVENCIPPYLIHHSRTKALKGARPDSPSFQSRPYDFIKHALLRLANKQAAIGHVVSDDEIRAEGCRVILAFQMLETSAGETICSWFRDLILDPKDEALQIHVRRKAGLPVRKRKRSDHTGHDEESVIKNCPLEQQLTDYVNSQIALGLTPTDAELQKEGCRIVVEYDRKFSTVHSATAAAWFCKMIMSSTNWLSTFRSRVGLPPSSKITNEGVRSNDRNSIDASIHNYQRVELELSNFVKTQAELGIVPSDSELQRQARLIIFDVDDPYDQTPADKPSWLARFKCEVGLLSKGGSQLTACQELGCDETEVGYITADDPNRPMIFIQESPPDTGSGQTRPMYTIKRSSCYHQHHTELTAFVSNFMLSSGPNSRVPTDEEIRQQARWIVYKDMSPSNVTIVDNAEWLKRFKQFLGLEGQEDCCRTPSNATLSKAAASVSAISQSSGTCTFGKCSFMASLSQMSFASVPSQFISGSIFFSWKLEVGLAEYVEDSLAQGFSPSNEDLQARARLVSGTSSTAADCPVLLQYFKQMYISARKLSIDSCGRASSAETGRPNLRPVSVPAKVSLPQRNIDTPHPNASRAQTPWFPGRQTAILSRQRQSFSTNH